MAVTKAEDRALECLIEYFGVPWWNIVEKVRWYRKLKAAELALWEG